MAGLKLSDWKATPEEREQQLMEIMAEILNRMTPKAREAFVARLIPQLIVQ